MSTNGVTSSPNSHHLPTRLTRLDRVTIGKEIQGKVVWSRAMARRHQPLGVVGHPPSFDEASTLPSQGEIGPRQMQQYSDGYARKQGRWKSADIGSCTFTQLALRLLQ